MKWLVTAAALTCDRLVDWGDKIPHGARSLDLVVTLEPFHARF